MEEILEDMTLACGETPEAVLLRKLNTTTQNLFAIHTLTEYADDLTSADAWNALQRSWQDPSYYFSIEELQFVMALGGTRVRIYTFEASVPGGIGYFNEAPAVGELLGESVVEDSPVHVVYDGSIA